MKRLLTWALRRDYFRRLPNAHLRHFERQLAAANSSPFAAWLSFSDEVASIGLVTDWRGMVEALEAEGSRLIGAVPCPGVAMPDGYHAEHGDFMEYGEALLRDVPHSTTCPSCKAAV